MQALDEFHYREDAMTMQHLLLAAAIFGISRPINALPVGACYPPAEARKKLRAEGQNVIRTSADNSIMVSYGDKESGYVLHARKNGFFCVVSTLQEVSTVSVPKSTDICDDPTQYPAAVKVCKDLRLQALRVKRTVTANSPQSILSNKMVGPVNTTLSFCADKSGREVLCGRSETLRNGVSPLPR